MTPPSHIPTPDPASYGHLVAAEDLVAGQYVYVRPLARSGREWCQVTGSEQLQRHLRLELTRAKRGAALPAPMWRGSAEARGRHGIRLTWR
jgi:hypothetical protein